MAANAILREFNAFINFADTGFKYNLQVFPDTVTAAALLFTLLFQNIQWGALTGALILLRFLHPTLSQLLTSVLDGTVGAGDPERCNGLFPGASYESLIGAASQKELGVLRNAWPSFYSTFLGFLAGYVGLLPVVYQAELAASPKRTVTTISGLVVLGIITTIGIIYRLVTECDTGFGVFIGVLSGFLMGSAVMAFLAYITDRRITNILNFPLIRGRAVDGKPIYVCERSNSG
jgi:hypothetical protein